jgi:uncharacterized protein YunC (DUF1805 family)
LPVEAGGRVKNAYALAAGHVTLCIDQLRESGRTQAVTLPTAINKTINFPSGEAIGTSYQWPGGQYCAIHTTRGLVGCGIYDIRAANEFNLAVAIARGTPAKPLRDPEDLFEAKILEVSQAAEKLGVKVGMTGRQAVETMLAAKTA